MKKIILLLILSFACLFTVVACKDNEDNKTPGEQTEELSAELKGARNFLIEMYGDGSEEATAADYTLASQVPAGNSMLAVTWSVNTESVKVSIVTEGDEAGNTLVDVQIGASEIKYVLTAKVVDSNGKELVLNFNRVVPAAKPATIAEFLAAGVDNNYYVLTATITADGEAPAEVDNADKAGSFVLSDETGTVFCYDKIVVTLGDKVKIVGKLSEHQGFPQFSSPAISEVISSNNDVVAASGELHSYEASVIKTDLAAGTDALNAKYAGQYLEITGYAKKNDKGFINLFAAFEDTTACVNLYANDALNMEQYEGQKIKVRGFMRGSASSYLTLQVQSAEAVQEVLTDEQKVERALASVKVQNEFNANAEVELPTTSNGAELTWELVGAALPEFTIADGKLVVTAGEANATQVLKVTATVGEVSDSKEITLKLELSLTFTSIADALEVAATKDHNTYTEEKYVLVGTVREIYNTTYGNLYLTDGTNEITVYGLYIEGSKYGEYTGAKFAAGDVIVVKGVLGKYNDTLQMKNADLVSWEPGTKHETISNEKANEYGNAVSDKNVLTEQKYTVKGYITSIANEQYGNIYIKDIYGTELYIYGLYSADGEVRYDAMETKPVVGDFVVVTGNLTKYNAAQMKSGWLLQLNTTDYTENQGGGETPTPDPGQGGETPESGVITIAKALEIGGTYTKDNYSTEKYTITGAITEVQNATYGNVVISDGTNSILVYGLYSADGTVRYDAMDNKPGLGDVITVTGVLGKYTSAQMKSGWVLDVEYHTCSEYKDATCKEPAKCVVCGEAKDDILADTHNYVDGRCTICNGADPNFEGEVKEVATVTLKYSGTTTGNMNGEDQAALLGLDDTLFSVVGAKINGETNNVGLNKSGQLRFYAKGNTLTVECANKIVSITVTFGSADGYNASTDYMTITVGDNTVNPTNNTYQINGNGFVLTNTAKLVITSIEITYEK